MADPTHGGREGVVLFDDFQRIFVAAGGDESDVALGAGVGGAGVLAGASASLGDEVGVGNSLGVGAIDGGPLRQALFVLVGHVDRADLGAVVATGALLEVNVAGIAAHRGGEVAGLSVQANQVGVGDDLDVEVTACFHQLGR